MQLTPLPEQPVCNISGTVHGQAFSSNLVLPEGFTINGTGVHLPTSNPDGSPHYEGTVTWTQPETGGACLGTCELTTSPSLRYSVLIAPKGNYIELAFSVRNLSGVAWDDVSCAICCLNMSQNPNLSDTIGTYTWARFDDGSGPAWQTVASRIAQPIGQYAFYVNNQAAPPIIRCCDTMIARMSQDQAQYCGIAFDHSPMLSGNMGAYAMCLHSNPSIGPLAAGDSISRRGRICLDESSLASLLGNVPIT